MLCDLKSLYESKKQMPNGKGHECIYVKYYTYLEGELEKGTEKMEGKRKILKESAIDRVYVARIKV